MGIISTIAGAVGSKVVNHFTGGIGNKVIDTVNDYLGKDDKLTPESTTDELMSAYYNKLTPEERLQVQTRFAELENESERINIELQKTMAESDKNNGGYRKWVSILMALTIVGTCAVYTYLVLTWSLTTGELPSIEIIICNYAIPAIILLLSFGLSGKHLKELISLLRPKEKTAVDKVVDKFTKKK